jgi:hypothetical protein
MTQKLAPHSHQILKSNNVEQVTEYIKLKCTYLQSRIAFNRADQLNLPGNRATFAERLDSDVLKAYSRNGSPCTVRDWIILISSCKIWSRLTSKCHYRLRNNNTIS